MVATQNTHARIHNHVNIRVTMTTPPRARQRVGMSFMNRPSLPSTVHTRSSPTEQTSNAHSTFHLLHNTGLIFNITVIKVLTNKRNNSRHLLQRLCVTRRLRALLTDLLLFRRLTLANSITTVTFNRRILTWHAGILAHSSTQAGHDLGQGLGLLTEGRAARFLNRRRAMQVHLVTIGSNARHVSLLTLSGSIRLSRVNKLLTILIMVGKDMTLNTKLRLIRRVRRSFHRQGTMIRLRAVNKSMLRHTRGTTIILTRVRRHASRFLKHSSINNGRQLSSLLSLTIQRFTQINRVVLTTVLNNRIMNSIQNNLSRIRTRLTKRSLISSFRIRRARRTATRTRARDRKNFQHMSRNNIIRLRLIRYVARFKRLHIISQRRANMSRQLKITMTERQLNNQTSNQNRNITRLKLARVFHANSSMTSLTNARYLNTNRIQASRASLSKVVNRTSARRIRFFTIIRFTILRASMNSSTTMKIMSEIRSRHTNKNVKITIQNKRIRSSLIRRINRTFTNFTKSTRRITQLTTSRAYSLLNVLIQFYKQRISFIRRKGSNRVVISNRMRIERNLHFSTLNDISRRRHTFTNNRYTKRLVNRIRITKNISRARHMFNAIGNP